MFRILPIEYPSFVRLVPVCDLSSVSSACFRCGYDCACTRSDPQSHFFIRGCVQVVLHFCDHFRGECSSCASSFDRDYLVHHRLLPLSCRSCGRVSIVLRLVRLAPAFHLRASALRTGLHAGASRTSAGSPRGRAVPLLVARSSAQAGVQRICGHTSHVVLVTAFLPARSSAGSCRCRPFVIGAGARMLGLRRSRGMPPSVAGVLDELGNIWCPASNSTPRACGLASFEDCLWLQVADGRVSRATSPEPSPPATPPTCCSSAARPVIQARLRHRLHAHPTSRFVERSS